MPEPITVGVRAFRENLSRYIAEVQDGASITIVSHGKPVAELKGAAPKRPIPRFGGLKGKIWMADDWDTWTEDELDAFEGDIFPPEDDE